MRHPLSMHGFQSHLRRWLSTLIGLAICTVSAAAASKVFAHTAWRGFVPWIFVIVLVVLASIYGTAVGVLGSVLSALIFAYWLYAPAGSVQIANPAARNGLAWMIVGGVALSYLLAPGFRHPDGPGRK